MMISKRWGGAQSEVNTSNTKKLRIHVTFLLNITTLNIESGIIIKSQDESLNKSRIAKFNAQLYCSKGDEVHFEVTCVAISYQFGLLTIYLQQSIENHYHSEIFCILLE